MEQKNRKEKNLIVFNKYINESTKKDLLKKFVELWTQETPPVLYILIDTNDGLMESALDIHSWIKAYKGRTRGIIIGNSGFAGNIIFAACEERFSLPNTKLYSL